MARYMVLLFLDLEVGFAWDLKHNFLGVTFHCS